MSRFEPLTPGRLITQLGAKISDVAGEHPTRVALDGPRCAQLQRLATALQIDLHQRGRSTAIVSADGFYRDASLRFEYGKQDIESFYSHWLDAASLQREVLDALTGSEPAYLPSLRDPVSNRSTRVSPVSLAADGVVLIVGELLLGRGLSFDLSLHAAVSHAARARHTEQEWHWSLAAFDRYDIDVDPGARADLVLRYDDPAHPALRMGRR